MLRYRYVQRLLLLLVAYLGLPWLGANSVQPQVFPPPCSDDFFIASRID